MRDYTVPDLIHLPIGKDMSGKEITKKVSNTVGGAVEQTKDRQELVANIINKIYFNVCLARMSIASDSIRFDLTS